VAKSPEIEHLEDAVSATRKAISELPPTDEEEEEDTEAAEAMERLTRAASE